jgi:RNA polymerase sigma-70 factor (ECF subfamily)
MIHFATSQVGRDTAEDYAQEVLVLLHTKYAHLTELSDLMPLSFQILRFKMVSGRRKGIRRGEHNAADVNEVPVPDGRQNPAEEYEKREMLERMTRALGGLGDRCRELFRLKLEGRAFPEIQAVMKANSINTVYTWDARCRKELMERMGGAWEPSQRRMEAKR